MTNAPLEQFDGEVYALIKMEEQRQNSTVDLIPSENFTHPAVREALSSVFAHKYAEGQIGARFYEGNAHVDALEALAKERAKKAFSLDGSWGVCVQPSSGAGANLAVYNGLLNVGDTIMSMFLPDGGHLSHGWSFPEEGESAGAEEGVYLGGARKVSIVSKIYNVVQYKTDPKTRLFDYDNISALAEKYKPKMIVTGGTAYPREIDYKAVSAIAKRIGALYMADVAHEAGLIAAGVNKSPFDYADVVTFTTHKTLRGPRGALIIYKKEFEKQIEFSVFPGLQGGPHEHSIAAIAVCLKDAASEGFREYAAQVVKNAQYLAEKLLALGYDVVSGGTDKHLVLIDLRDKQINARNLALALNAAGIVLNKNTVPGETKNSVNPSGIRMGTPSVTTRGMKEPQMDIIVSLFSRVTQIVKPVINLKYSEFAAKLGEISELNAVKDEVAALCARFPFVSKLN